MQRAKKENAKMREQIEKQRLAKEREVCMCLVCVCVCVCVCASVRACTCVCGGAVMVES